MQSEKERDWIVIVAICPGPSGGTGVITSTKKLPYAKSDLRAAVGELESLGVKRSLTATAEYAVSRLANKRRAYFSWLPGEKPAPATGAITDGERASSDSRKLGQIGSARSRRAGERSGRKTQALACKRILRLCFRLVSFAHLARNPSAFPREPFAPPNNST